MVDDAQWQPDWAVSPGEVLAEELEARAISQAELARRMDRPLKTINEIINAKASITPETAIQLELALGVSSALWSGLEREYRDALARQRVQDQLADYVDWAHEFPVHELVVRDLLPNATGPRLVEALLKFFRVSTIGAWDRQWAQSIAVHRQSTSYEASAKAVAAWLRWGQLEAESRTTAKFDRREFRRLTDGLRSLTREEPFADVLRDLTDQFSAAGVVFLVLPDFPATRLSGATHWIGGTPVVQLSLRHRKDDQFWFTLLHECGHVLQGRDRVFVDQEDRELSEQADHELEADDFAREALVPASVLEIRDGQQLSRAHVLEIADKIDVAPGIVVGRLQRDGHLDPSSALNRLKRSLNWS